jgi:integrative and conjugative element protein (TIGR02256 family)
MRLLQRREPSVGYSTVWLAMSASQAMLDEANRAAQLETGGVLLGYISPIGHLDVVVELALGPGPSARHAEHHFDPDADWQQRQISAVYSASGRTCTYLGDWHTHPNGTAVPSPRDRKTARHIARTRTARTPHPVMAILGRQRCHGAAPHGWVFAVYRWDGRGLCPVRTQVMNQDRRLLG